MAAKPGREPSSLERMGPVGKFGLAFLFVLLIGSGYLIGFYEELAEQITAAQDREGALRGELQRAQASKEAYQRDLEEKTRREQLGREQKKILPDDPETPAFLSALQGSAIIAGVNLTSWSPTEEVPREVYAKVPMKLTLTGKFHQVVKFVHSVGQLDRIINIENIQFKAVTDKTADIEVSVECLATAFRAVRIEEAGASKRRGAGR
ncbi:MAG TPA: type 4a pilus biogenesis protein PilO [Polyangiaceae bacterium]|nr:type 4a pilus biogenesis protein PilO [Polyangiaceae bacterium]